MWTGFAPFAEDHALLRHFRHRQLDMFCLRARAWRGRLRRIGTAPLLAFVMLVLSAAVQVPVASAAGNLTAESRGAWQPNGTINEVLPSADGTKAYVGGNFTYLGPVTGSAVRMDALGVQSGAWPAFLGGSVHDIVPVPLAYGGGWVVAGGFRRVGLVDHSYLARINPTGELDAFWGGRLDGPARALELVDGTLYVGGTFANYEMGTVNPVRSLIALDVSNGALLWSGPTMLSGSVLDLEPDGTNLYVGGDFTSYDGTPSSVVRIDASTRVLDAAWPVTPPGGAVHSIAYDGTRTIVGGSFGSVFSYDPDGSLVWWASHDGVVRAVDATSTSVYVGGEFGTIGGVARTHLAALDSASGVAMTWAPAVDGPVFETHAVGSTVFIGGAFTRVAGVRRHGAAAIDGGVLTGFDPMAGHPARVFVVDGTSVMMGGDFHSIGGVERLNIGAIDLATGAATDWNPLFPAGWGEPMLVNALAERNGRVYVGGVVPGPWAGMVIFDAASGAYISNTTWGGGSTPAVLDLEVDHLSGKLFVAGPFSGSPRVFDATETAVTWNVAAADIRDIEIDAGVAYLAGSFTTVTVGGANYARNRAAAVEIASAALKSFNPAVTEAGAAIDDLAIDGTQVWIAGTFTWPEPNIYRANLADGTTLGAADTATGIKSVHSAGGYTYVGGTFPARLKQLDSNGALAGWSPILAWYFRTLPDSGVYDIANVGSSILAGGRQGFAIFEATAGDLQKPVAQLRSLEEPAPGDPADATHVMGDTVIVRTTGATPPTFTAHLRSHDTVSSTSPGYGGVSGLAELRWPSIPNTLGTWTPGGIDAGAPRGLKLGCWQQSDAAVVRYGIDTLVNYPAALPPDQPGVLPATLMDEVGAVLQYDSGSGIWSYEKVSCRWSGHVVGLSDQQRNYQFQAFADNGMRITIDGVIVVDHWSVASPPDYSPLSPSVDFTTSQARELVVDWYDGTGPAAAQLLWDGATAGTQSVVPPGALVTSVDYARTYSFSGGVAGSSAASDMIVEAVDAAGNSSIDAGTGRTFTVVTDNLAPASSSLVTTPGSTTWSNADPVMISMTDSPDDGGAGIHTRLLQRTDTTIDASGACAEPTAPITWIVVASYSGTTSRSLSQSLPTGCYRYRYVAIDNVGNRRVDYPTDDPAGSAWIRIDREVPIGGQIAYADTIQSSTSVFVDVVELPTDAHSGIDSATIAIERAQATYYGGACQAYGTFGPVHATTAAGVWEDTSLVTGTCYKYRLTAYDIAGNLIGVHPASANEVRVDTAAPTASFASAPIGPVNGTSVQISGDASDLVSGVDVVDVRFTGPAIGNICLDAPLVAGVWDCVWDTTVVPSGNYLLHLDVRDFAGNLTTVTRTLLVDNHPPDLTLPAPIEATGMSFQHWNPSPATLWVNPAQSGSMTFGATVFDHSATTVNFPALAGTWTITGTLADSTAPYEIGYAWSAGAVDPGPKLVTAVDELGQSSSVTFELGADAIAPTVAVPTYPDGPTQSTSVTVSWAAPTDAESGIDPLAVELRRQDGTLTPSGCTWPTGSTPITGATSPYLDTNLVDGMCYRYKIVATDNVGNVAAAAATNEVRVDLTNPLAEIDDTTPVGPVSGTVTLVGTVIDDSATKVDVLFTGPTNYMVCDELPVAADGTWSCPWNTVATTSGTDGSYTVYVVATDAAGNVQDLADTRALVVDNSPPVLAPAITPATGTAFQHVLMQGGVPHAWVNGNQSGSFRLDSGAADDQSGVASVSFPALGTGWTMSEVVDTAGPPYETTYWWSAGAEQPVPTPSTFTATNSAGVSSTGSFEVHVDTDLPAGGSITYPDGIGAAAELTFAPGTDAGVGVSHWLVQRSEKPTQSQGVCSTTATWSTWSQVGPTSAASPMTDSTVQRGRCYRYRLLVHDLVGHVVEYASANVFITDSIGVVITPGASMTAVEGGATAGWTVALRAAPMPGSSVTITLAGDGQVAPAATTTTLTFTDTDWNIAQPVTVGAIDDLRDEVPDTQPASVTHDVTSSDPDYDALATITQGLQVTDNDVAGVQLSPTSGLTVAEAGTTATYQVRLATEPAKDVTISLGVPAQLSATPTTVTFTPGDWSTAKDVSVTAVDDPVVEGAHAAAITHAAASGDPVYQGIAIAPTNVGITDNDAAGLEVVTSATTPALDEAAATTTDAVRVRLTARPSTNVTVATSAVAGQLEASPASLTFSTTSWDQYQTISVAPVDDTVAEPTPHAAQVLLDTSSADANFAAVADRVVSYGVRDDDPVAVIGTPGDGWNLDAQGRLKLAEGGASATIHLHLDGDPTMDVKITPRLTPAGELQVTPTSATIPGGSHDHVVSFTVRATDDNVAEPTPHPARIEGIITTNDPMYAIGTAGYTDVLIADGAERELREETSTTSPTETTPTSPAPNEPAPDDTTTASEDDSTDPAPPAGDDSQSASDDDQDSSGGSDPAPPANEREGAKEDDAGAVTRTARRVKTWAKENKGKASIAASAAGSAAIWGAKPLLLAGKALGGGGLPGLPGPDGIGQARRLLRVGKKSTRPGLAGRILRGLLRRRRDIQDTLEELHPLDQLDRDWDDFYNDRAA